MPIIFEPTLLPDPFGETSPELCWQLNSSTPSLTLSIRLTQFGWSLVLRSDFLSNDTSIRVQSDTLIELKESLLSHPLLPSHFFHFLDSQWVLAYDLAT